MPNLYEGVSFSRVEAELLRHLVYDLSYSNYNEYAKKINVSYSMVEKAARSISVKLIHAINDRDNRIESLALSARTHNRLAEAYIDSIVELKALGSSGVKRIEGIGEVAFAEIKLALQDYSSNEEEDDSWWNHGSDM